MSFYAHSRTIIRWYAASGKYWTEDHFIILNSHTILVHWRYRMHTLQDPAIAYGLYVAFSLT